MKNSTYLRTFLSSWIGILMIFFGFAANAQTGTTDHATAEKDLATAKAAVEAYEEQDWKQLRTFLTDDAMVYGLASFDSLDADQSISYWTEGTEKATPELKDETWLSTSFTTGPRQGNWVYHWGVNTLTYTDGQVISFPYHLALKIDDEKVEEAHFYYDNMKIIREMGFALSPPLEEEESETEMELEQGTLETPTIKK